ncbi:probable signal peptidase complex subunit 2 [Pollicipes pollicipes]|uniref:probable signal peptidase complex subunit 2 n=1 Tax=Pollicipes pollicipes TaxID=41117 RepID=UPI001884929F|nr:probable signal peptidase complex subunit 2 [Pollicipes pollicipes]XP_037075087.1 probable signal peptidase complex subunit 2 [Pollicipes pollicipes]
MSSEDEIKVDKWDGSAVKNSLDDAVKEVLLSKYKYGESHWLMDCRLFICTVAVGLAGLAIVWDYLHPFPLSRPILIFCVVSYFVLMGILTLYTTYVEKNVFLVAVQKDPSGMDPDSKWEVSSTMKRFDDSYTLSIRYVEGASARQRQASVTRTVAAFFDENGVLVRDCLQPVVTKLHNSLLAGKKDK